MLDEVELFGSCFILTSEMVKQGKACLNRVLSEFLNLQDSDRKIYHLLKTKFCNSGRGERTVLFQEMSPMNFNTSTHFFKHEIQ